MPCDSVECEAKHALRSSGGAIRRALFRVERGVCVKCKADCHGLVERLRAIERGSREWEARRRARIAEYAPRCAGRHAGGTARWCAGMQAGRPAGRQADRPSSASS